MKRPVGVTVSAVFSLLGSLAMVGLLVLLGALVLVSSRPAGAEAKLGLGISVVMFGALGAWGLATAIGLFALRNWARISIVVFSVLLALTGLVSAPVILLMPMPNVPSSFGGVRIVIAVVYGALGLLGAVWLYYFNRRATREAFARGAPVVESARPLSISIIGWWLLISGVVTVLATPLRLPALVLMWVLTGWAALVWYLAWGGLYAYVGYGLLRLNPVARSIAIAALCIGFIHAAISFVLPGRDARFAVFMSQLPFRAHITAQPSFPPTTFMIATMLIGVGVPLWFLVTRKGAFERQSVVPQV